MSRSNPVLNTRSIITIVIVSALTNVALGHLAALRSAS